MNTEIVFQDIQALNNLVYLISKKQPEALAELNRLYLIVYGQTVTAGCSGCHLKAFKKLTSLSLQDLEKMKNQKFKLKEGVLLEYPFRSGDFVSNASDPEKIDRVATAYLNEYPARVDQFEIYPGSDSESKEYQIQADVEDAVDLSKLNKAELQAEYAKAFGEAPEETLTKAELTTAIQEKQA